MGKSDELGAMNKAETYKRGLTYKDGKELILPKTNCKGESVLSNDIFKVSRQSRDTHLCVNEGVTVRPSTGRFGSILNELSNSQHCSTTAEAALGIVSVLSPWGM